MMLVTRRSQIKEVSKQVGLLITLPLYTDTLLPPPSRFWRTYRDTESGSEKLLYLHLPLPDTVPLLQGLLPSHTDPVRSFHVLSHPPDVSRAVDHTHNQYTQLPTCTRYREPLL